MIARASPRLYTLHPLLFTSHALSLPLKVPCAILLFLSPVMFPLFSLVVLVALGSSVMFTIRLPILEVQAGEGSSSSTSADVSSTQRQLPHTPSNCFCFFLLILVNFWIFKSQLLQFNPTQKTWFFLFCFFFCLKACGVAEHRHKQVRMLVTTDTEQVR